MDDVLSAVDPQVAVHIYNECVRKLLLGKTRILVTHCSKLLTSADWVIVIENGTITKQGILLSSSLACIVICNVINANFCLV